MSEKVLAKDAKAGQWYEDDDGTRHLCCDGRKIWTQEHETWNAPFDLELTHLPDCTGWDWQPPKPEKKYRPFSGADEFLSHLEGRCPLDWFYRTKSERKSSCRSIARFDDATIDGRTWIEAFESLVWSNDGTPFGVEVTE